MLFVIVFIVALRTKETYDPIQNMSSFSVASTWFFPDFTRVFMKMYVHFLLICPGYAMEERSC
jgi:hypothetical protein